MNLQKHKSIRLNPGVKRIQNYIFKFNDLLGKGNFSSVYKGSNELTSNFYLTFRLNCSYKIYSSIVSNLREIEITTGSININFNFSQSSQYCQMLLSFKKFSQLLYNYRTLWWRRFIRSAKKKTFSYWRLIDSLCSRHILRIILSF